MYCLYFLSQYVPDMFHIHPSMDECWINEMYMYVCMYRFLQDPYLPIIDDRLNGRRVCGNTVPTLQPSCLNSFDCRVSLVGTPASYPTTARNLGPETG
jgi:hypothetical protein